MQIQPICDKCGALASLDALKTNSDYKVWQTDKPCSCGGKFVVKGKPIPTMKNELSSACVSCEHRIRVDVNHVYIPCVVYCIKTGQAISR